MAHITRRDYPTPSPSPSPSPTIKQEELPLSNSISSPHLESTRTLALWLSEPQRHSQSNSNYYLLPCEQCRKVRRACRWVKLESSERSSCERCGKTGKQCSGPRRRSQTNLEIGQPLRQLQTRRQAAASIGPSSPESRWSTKHMSYSLTYHLVETGLRSYGGGYKHEGFDYRDFVRRHNITAGRNNEMDSVNQLFALTQMYIGTYCSTHTASSLPLISHDRFAFILTVLPDIQALLRSATTVPDLESSFKSDLPLSSLTAIGMARREPFLAIATNIAEQACRLSFDLLEPQKALDFISVMLFAVGTTRGLQENDENRLLFIRDLIQQGSAYPSRARERGPPIDDFLSPLKEIVLEEVQLSLLLNRSTAISVSQYRSLFDRQLPEVMPILPPDPSFIFSAPPESLETRQMAFAFQDDWRTFPPSLFHHLEYILTFSSVPQLE